MSTKRSPASAESTSAKRGRHMFSSEEGPETIHVHPGAVDHHMSADDALEGHSEAGVSMMEGFDGAAALAAMESASGAHHQQESMIREQDRFLPIANVSRIMKRVLPESGKVAKEAKECVQECVSEFISFITSEASERCMHEKRKTINGEDILWAMQTLGFDPYVEPLKIYLSKYRLAVKSDKNPSNNAAIPVAGYGNVIIGERPESAASSEAKLTGAGNQGTPAPMYLTQEDLVQLGGHGEARQVHLATNADGQLTIIEMRTDGDGNVDAGNTGATAITLPVLSGTSTGENGAQQYILTTLDQNSIGGAGVQQFTIPAGAQLAFIPASGQSGQGATATTSQGIPVMLLDSVATSSSGGGQQSSQQQQQYITMNTTSGTAGLQIIHVPTSMVGGTISTDDAGRNGAGVPGGSTMGE